MAKTYAPVRAYRLPETSPRGTLRALVPATVLPVGVPCPPDTRGTFLSDADVILAAEEPFDALRDRFLD